jgi:hypothetical protein
LTHISRNYAAKLAIARELASLGARAVTISSIAKTKPADSRAQYKLVRGVQSQPGQTPTDHEWFLFNQVRRQHGALLLAMYASYRAALDSSPDAHGLAVVITYKMYIRLTLNKPIVSVERLNLLVGTGFNIGWRGILKGGSSKFSSDNVKVALCKKCRVPHLVEAHYLNYICPSHQNA